MLRSSVERFPNTSKTLESVPPWKCARATSERSHAEEGGDAEFFSDDHHLISRAARGSLSAQQVVVRRLGGRVRRTAQLILGQRAEVDDVVQQALLQILRSAHQFSSTQTVEEWGERIAIRVARRTSLRLRQEGKFIEELCDTGDEAVPPLVEAIDLESALSSLSVQRREALILKYGFGYTIAEIAEIAGIPSGTVKDRLIVAKRQLRESAYRDELRMRNAMRE